MSHLKSSRERSTSPTKKMIKLRARLEHLLDAGTGFALPIGPDDHVVASLRI